MSVQESCLSGAVGQFQQNTGVTKVNYTCVINSMQFFTIRIILATEKSPTSAATVMLRVLLRLQILFAAKDLALDTRQNEELNKT